MNIPKQLFFLGGLVLSVLLFPMLAHAECGAQLQCIAVSIDPLVAPSHGTPLTSSPLNFGSQTVATTSAARTVLVAAVFGPVGTKATLDAITLVGPNAADFGISGGTCTVGTPTLLHDGATTAQLSNTCTITVTFNPATNGAKSATLAVQTTSITRTIPLTGTAGYPDLAQDPAVAGTLAAQTETAQRFSRAQIVNFQHRMESLHDGNTSAPGASASLAADAGRNASIELFANNLVALMTTQTLDLASLSHLAGEGAAAGAPGDAADASGFWVAGMANFGTRDATGSRSGLGFSSNGITLGFDRRFSDQWAAGIGLGFARDKTDIGGDGSSSRTQGNSIVVYGSYQPSRQTFVDGMIGAGTLKFETQRYVSTVNSYARSDRDGSQIFGSLAAGYEYRDYGLLFSPYARLDYSTNRLKQSTETGAGQFDLSYASQTSSAAQGALGVRGESVHPTSFGYASPRIRAEYRHDFQRERSASVAYAGQPGARYAIPAGAVQRNAMVLGVGNDFVMRNGATIGIDYQYLHSFSQDTNYAVLLQFSKDLDERGTPGMPGGYSLLPSESMGIQVDAGYMFDDNVTRAKTGADKHADRSYSVNLGKTIVFPAGDHTRALLTGSLGGERFHNYDGLSRLTGGVQGEFQYRSSAEFSAPIFGIFVKANADRYNSDLRDGYRSSTGISMRQPVTDRIRLFGALARNGRNVKNAVFDTRDNSARLNLDYELSSSSTIYLGGEYRRGDVVTTGPSTGMYNASVISAPDDAFPYSSSGGGQLTSYRLDGKTALMTLGYNIGFGPRDAIDLSWRRIRSTLDTANTSGSYASNSSASSYTANQYTVTYLVRF